LSHGENDIEVSASIENLFKVASNNQQRAEDSLSSLDIRVRATIALGAFLPLPLAKRHLISLMASSEVPIEIRSVASQTMNGKANA
jgi:hypothetical protein